MRRNKSRERAKELVDYDPGVRILHIASSGKGL
jgi:hypothetical protein